MVKRLLLLLLLEAQGVEIGVLRLGLENRVVVRQSAALRRQRPRFFHGTITARCAPHAALTPSSSDRFLTRRHSSPSPSHPFSCPKWNVRSPSTSPISSCVPTPTSGRVGGATRIVSTSLRNFLLLACAAR
jgi:hypothetical protein